MASIRKQKAGAWRVQVRRKGRSVSENFVRYEGAKQWAVDTERQIDRGETPTVSRVGKLKTFGDLIDLHISDMKEVGKAPGRSKEATLKMLKRKLGKLSMVAVDRERIVKFGRERSAEGAGPTTIGIDVGVIKLAFQHAAAVHGLPVQVEPVDLGRVALKRLGLIGHSNERDRRPTDEELEKLIAHFNANPRQIIPMGRIIKFAVATASRVAFRGISRSTTRMSRQMPWSSCRGRRCARPHEMRYGCAAMRLLLALLAVLGLLASPVAASAAQAACSHEQAGAMAGMPMADMPGMHHGDGQKADPCCDPLQDHGPGKHDKTDCAKACAAMCAATAALRAGAAHLTLASSAADLPPARLKSLHTHEPGGLERPPRSIA